MPNNLNRSHCRACKFEASEAGSKAGIKIDRAQYQVIRTVELPDIVTPVPTRRNLCQRHFQQAITPQAGVVIKSVIDLKSGRSLDIQQLLVTA